MIPSPISASHIHQEGPTRPIEIARRQKIQSALDVLAEHSATGPWKKEEVQEGLEILKEAVSDLPFSCETHQKIYTLANTLLQLEEKKGGRFIPHDQKALLEHMTIASTLRSNPEPLTADQMSQVLGQFRSKENQALLKKWKEAGLDLRAFLYNPMESRFILHAHLEKAARYWNDEIRFHEEDMSIHMRIEGEYQDVRSFVHSVHLKKSPLIPISSITRDFITDNEDPAKVWEYMPERGLSLHHSSNWESLPITGQLSPEEVAYAQEKAKLHGKGAENGQYVVELVSLWKKPKKSALSSGVEDLKSGEHPWIRLIKPDGTYYSVGFNLGQKLSLPGAISKGVFLSPDPREPLARTGRVVTGIKITEAQFSTLVQQIETEQRQEVDFHFLEQNCTKFLQSVVDTLQVETPQKPVFYARISEVAFRALPKGVQTGLKAIKRVVKPIGTFLGDFIPPIVVSFFRSIGNFFQYLGERFLLWAAGRQTIYLNKKNIRVQQEDPHRGVPWYRFAEHARIASENSLVQTFLPIKLIEWQMQVFGTRVYEGSTSFHAQYRKQLIPSA